MYKLLLTHIFTSFLPSHKIQLQITKITQLCSKLNGHMPWIRSTCTWFIILLLRFQKDPKRNCLLPKVLFCGYIFFFNILDYFLTSHDKKKWESRNVLRHAFKFLQCQKYCGNQCSLKDDHVLFLKLFCVASLENGINWCWRYFIRNSPLRNKAQCRITHLRL